MAYVAVDAGGHQGGGLLKSQELGLALSLPGGFSPTSQRADPENKRDDAEDEQEPGDELVPGERVLKPGIDIEQEQRQDELPGEETVKAVRTGRAKRGARDIGKHKGENQEGDDFPECHWLISVFLKVSIPPPPSPSQTAGRAPGRRWRSPTPAASPGFPALPADRPSGS